MAFEVASGEIGVARTTHVLRNVPVDATSIVLLVLLRGAPPIRQRIAIGQLLGGRGVHRGLVCAKCSRPKYSLFATSSGLTCGPCARRRSRRQLEHRSRAWRQLGGDLEDIVLRGLRPGRRSSVVPEAIADAANVLMTDDRERAVVLLRRANDAFNVAVAANLSARDLLEKEVP